MVEVKTGDFVVPGDYLATAEEFMPGEGAYEEDGKVYSSCTGVLLVDVRTKHISVFPRTTVPPELKRGDIIVGKIEEVRDQTATVHIGVLRGREDRQLPLPDYGSIHISQVRGSYLKDLSHEFRAGDIVRARVTNVRRGSIQLTTAGENLGVIMAACSRCRTPLDNVDDKLKCPSCGNVELRKLASDYRQGTL
jgi:exosome complex component CSL4